MSDAIFLTLLAACCAATLGLVSLCNRLMPRPPGPPGAQS